MQANRNRDRATFPQLLALVRDVRRREPVDSCEADVKEAVKQELLRLGFFYPSPDELALALDYSQGPLPDPQRPRRPGDLVDDGHPVDHASAVKILKKLQQQAGIAPAIHSMPRAKPHTEASFTKQRARQIYAQAIRDQVEVVDALEEQGPPDGEDTP